MTITGLTVIAFLFGSLRRLAMFMQFLAGLDGLSPSAISASLLPGNSRKHILADFEVPSSEGVPNLAECPPNRLAPNRSPWAAGVSGLQALAKSRCGEEVDAGGDDHGYRERCGTGWISR